MAKDYLDEMRRKDNLCRAYLQKARAEHNRNGYTADEGRFLQEAVRLQGDMARISDGTAREYHLQRQQEIKAQLLEVVREVSPDTYQHVMRAGSRGKSADDRDEIAGDVQRERKRSAGAAKNNGEGKEDGAANSRWFPEKPDHTFDDVSGMSELKAELRSCIHDVQMDKLRDLLKMSRTHSFFFYGPPGCGKTYIIEAFARELVDKGYSYMSLDGSDILSRYVGDAEKTVTQMFEEAEAHAPCVLFIDEIDGVCRSRSEENQPVWMTSLTNSFLVGYNRIQNADKPIIFLGATNYPQKVDNAMLDRVKLIYVDFPDTEALTYAYEKKFGDIVSLEDGFSCRDMAEMTEGYNYRDVDRLSEAVKNLILEDVASLFGDDIEQMSDALQDKNYCLGWELFEQAVDNYEPTPKEEIRRSLMQWRSSFLHRQREDG